MIWWGVGVGVETDTEETCQIAGWGKLSCISPRGTQDVPRHSTFECIGRAGVVPQVCSGSLCEPRDDSIIQCEEVIGAPQAHKL